MKIYIASSWRNQHGVELLTSELRGMGHEVISWVENNYGEQHNHVTKKVDFETWVNSDEAVQSFVFDTDGATKCDLFIYYGPAGMDACAELGAAWASNIPIVGLWAKGEGLGLMRGMVGRWFGRYLDLLEDIKNKTKNPHSCFGREPHPMDFEDKDEFQTRFEAFHNWNDANENPFALYARLQYA